MQELKHIGIGAIKPLLCTALSMLALLTMGCSGSNQIPGQPFPIPFSSHYITTPKALMVSSKLSPDGSDERYFRSITNQDFYFDNKNCTATVRLILNRSASVDMPDIGDWSTVSVGTCLSDEPNINCYTAHIDCHLVRTTFIPTGKRSLAVIRVRNRAREPQEICERWDAENLSPEQQEEIETFNRTSDSLFIYK